jgi:hypothetical protein
MFRSFDEQPPRAAASAVAYLDERRARRLGSGAQLEARDRAAGRLGEAALRYQRHVLAWYPLGRTSESAEWVLPDPEGSRHGNLGRNSRPA